MSKYDLDVMSRASHISNYSTERSVSDILPEDFYEYAQQEQLEIFKLMTKRLQIKYQSDSNKELNFSTVHHNVQCSQHKQNPVRFGTGYFVADRIFKNLHVPKNASIGTNLYKSMLPFLENYV